MGDQVKVSVGLLTGAVQTGLLKLKGQFQGLRQELKGELFGALAAGATLAGLHAIFEKASQISDLSGRFGIGAEGLQRIGNAAEQNGASMEAVAKGMNKLLVAQDKVRQGDATLTESLDTLGISADKFINASPEEAFYLLSDAVVKADDRTAAYAATQALLGRGSQELFTTLEMGGDAIRELGNSMGIMSQETADALDTAGDKIEAFMNNVKIYGADALSVLMKVGKTLFFIGNWLASGVLDLMGDDAAAARLQAEAEASIKGVWSEADPDGSASRKKRKTVADLDEQKEKLKTADSLAQAEQRLADARARNMLAALNGAAKLSELEARRLAAQEKADKLTDPREKTEALLKVAELEGNIADERRRLASEDEAKLERLNARRASFADKQADAELDAMTSIDDKRWELFHRKAKIDGALVHEEDPIKIMDLLEDRMSIDKQMAALVPTKPKFDLITSSLASVGGGGGAYLSQAADPQKQAAAALVIANKLATESKQVLNQIRDKIGNDRWNP